MRTIEFSDTFDLCGAKMLSILSPGLTRGPGDVSNKRMPYYVYILASGRNGTLYTGMTNNLSRRMEEHKTGCGSDFTGKYHVDRLVYAEVFEQAEDALRRERALKRFHRAWKLDLIEKDNPRWEDLSSRWL